MPFLLLTGVDNVSAITRQGEDKHVGDVHLESYWDWCFSEKSVVASERLAHFAYLRVEITVPGAISWERCTQIFELTILVKGRVVIVTGGGTGIGRAYAKHFAAHGAIPVIAEINGQAGSSVAAEIDAAGGRALAVQTDVSDEESVAEMIARAMEEFGRIDVLLNNAAIFSTVTRSRFEDITRDDWTKMLDVEGGYNPLVILH